MIRFFRRRCAVAVAIGVVAVGMLGAVPASAQDDSAVSISGSSTVEPITSLTAELFAEEQPDATIRVDGPGTGDGFVVFCQGETDASDASRPIKDEGDEAPACEANGIEYTELPVGIDGLTVVVNNASKIKCLSFNDLYAMFGPESGGGETDLSEVSTLATELGDSLAPKAGSVQKFTPGPESGTYDSFIEITYQSIMDERLAAGSVPTDKVGTNDDGEEAVIEPLLAAGTFPNDNEIVKRVEGSEDGIGFFGYAYYSENKGDLKDVAIENPDTGKCVKPTAKTIRDGSYPISRQLFIYPNNAKLSESSTFKDFMDFYMTKQNLTDTVELAGYVSLAPADIKSSLSTYKGIGA